jgi:NADH-quinone oxidoreductase subunit N
VTAFFSTVPKAILLGFIIKLCFIGFDKSMIELKYCFCVSGLGAVCYASVAALYQKRIKRLLAYSTISHTGFIFLAIFCLTSESIKACSIYIVLYITMTLGLFGIIFLSNISNNNKKYLINWVSLFDRNQFIAISFSILFFSLAGIPPLSGFFSKLIVIFCLISQNHIVITAVIAVFSSIACFYYIKFIKLSFFDYNNKSQF